MKRLLLPLVAGSMLAGQASAFVVNDIRLDGLQRVSAGTVFNILPIAIGDDVSGTQVADAAKALFKTGYFQDIQLGRDGDVLVVTMVERPSISKIEIEGNKAIKTEDLLNGLKQSGLAEGEIFQQATLEAIRMELERQYVAQGRYGARIEADVKPMPRNRVGVTIKVKEGKVSTIKDVNIVGASVFDREELLELFELKKSNWLSWYSSDDKYSREKLSGDLERLRSYYLDRGYINFNITSTQVSITPDKEGVYVTVNVDEGEKFTVKGVKLAGDLAVERGEIEPLLLVKDGQTFSRQLMTTTEELITRRLGNEGYTFANVAGIPKPNADDNTVDITFFVEPGRRAYVRRINFTGNVKTEDEVLRREMRQMEGASANTAQIEQSKARLGRLGYFKQVDVETVPVPGTSDLVDVNYTVEEQPSGSITASLGFSQSDGLILGGSISQDNFLGSGNKVALSLNTSDTRKLYSFSFNDPYYTVDGVSRGYSLYYSETNYKDSDISNYNVDTMGADVNFGYPISEISSLRFGVGIDNNKLKEGTDPAREVQQFLAREGDNFTNFTGNIGIYQSTLNNGLLPTRGWSQSLSAEVTIPGSDLRFYKLNYRGQYFQPLTKSLTLRLATRLGYGGAYGDTTRLPFFENYYAGGFGSVRGYKDNTLGPRALQVDGDYDPLGGNVLVEGTAEVLFPLPFIKDQRQLRTSAFFDMGNVFSTDCDTSKDSSGKPYATSCYKPDLQELRYSVGVGLTWITPMGPLTFSLAKALKTGEDDETQVFQFSLGTPF
ncbi:outer membrane protein assembly factor BamA [Parendozoicomonas haliclonae]|uniref:Outer membrane protein assembly factor BamA n=1 Tax=Parendozoicomonas haliclonae TaxID=1960125 RepID=A0A1X7AHX1_9GAMM|nr:outer membrane protein assembly factor BamA [Parendozoicomonas haliclonae]SMA42527.1 Outer membrane protein assembly factor BamA precursor [Parendozoicomonas haliclonae]